MQIDIKTQDGITVAAIKGAIDGKTSAEAQATLTPLLSNGSRLILDMTDVTYLSSAGLRVLLLIYRQSTSASGKLALVGLSDEVKDIMNVTGFLKFFNACESVDAALTAVKS